jgi:hypothetical protein
MYVVTLQHIPSSNKVMFINIEPNNDFFKYKIQNNVLIENSHTSLLFFLLAIQEKGMKSQKGRDLW